MRNSVSMRGGLPPASSRAIADCVVPVSSASSACERPSSFRRPRDFLRHLREEPSLVGIDVREPFAEALESFRPHIASLL